MKQNTSFFLLICLFSTLALYGLGEKTLTVGAASGWDTVKTRERITTIPSVRPFPVLALASAQNLAGPGGRTARAAGPDLDIALSFDEGRPDLFADGTGHYSLMVSPAVTAVTQRWARAGTGAAHFSGSASTEILAAVGDLETLVLTPRGPEALLYQGRRFRDFTLEFWLNPMNMENGEQILFWSATRRTARGEDVVQRIQCTATRNRLQWTFQDLFADPGDSRRLTFSFSGITPVTPQIWSHHLIRFNSTTGLLEYLVNGTTESIRFVTSTGREGGEVYTPIGGQGSKLVLGGRYAGLMDEFRLHGAFMEEPALAKYPRQGGRMETMFLDLGVDGSQIIKVDAQGGRISSDLRSADLRAAAPGNTGRGREVARPINPAEYAGGIRPFTFSDGSGVQFFIRTGDTPYPETAAAWRLFEPGVEIPGLEGRYVQVAAEFYPSGDGESTPYLDGLQITYRPDAAPRPPTQVTAIPRDGGVDLIWNNSVDKDTQGYFVYYGASRGDYFGVDALQGKSPINVGKRMSVHIDGLQNGSLYYFSITAYDRLNPLHEGEFSREVSARPLRMIE
ncbi:hypothetical protein AGMMS49991_08000 [Spirochaetia bacterium]|nr:hypothetical protein AGMMS49991_08000 [Spirochaetia bacterium]